MKARRWFDYQVPASLPLKSFLLMNLLTVIGSMLDFNSQRTSGTQNRHISHLTSTLKSNENHIVLIYPSSMKFRRNKRTLLAG